MEISENHPRARVKLAIVGLGPSGSEAPFDSAMWEIWSLPWYPYPRVDRWFEIHENWDTGGWYGRKDRGEIIDWLNLLDAPVVMEKVEPEIRKSLAYPFRGVLEIAGKPLNTEKNEPYIDCSIAAMIGMACLYLKRGDTIGLWGVELRGKYEVQRANIEYLLGILKGRGINVFIHHDSTLLNTAWSNGRYGKNGNIDIR